MAERRVYRSDPDFQRLFDLASDLAMAKNPQRWFDLCGDHMDEAEPERLATVAKIEAQLEEALAERSFSETVFFDAIEGLDLTGLEPFG